MSGNTKYGTGALNTNTTGNNCSAFGNNAAYTTNANNNVTAFGTNSLYACNAANNTAFGSYSGYSTSTGTDNTYLGKYAGYNTTTGAQNVYAGSGTVGSSKGYYNVVVGAGSYTNVPGTGTGEANNVILGAQSATSACFFDDCVGVGYRVFANHGSRSNIARSISMGSYAGNSLIGDDNITIGYQNATDGGGTPGINTGSKNVSIGNNAFRALNTVTACNNNVLIGTEVLGDSNKRFIGSGNIMIGYRAGYAAGKTSSPNTQNNNIWIGNEGNDTDSGVIRLGNHSTNLQTSLVPKVVVDTQDISDDRYTQFTSYDLANPSGTRGDIVIQTLTGGNRGYMTINFNGYYNAGEQRYNTAKARWRFGCDQRGIGDELFIDRFDGSTLSKWMRLNTLSGTTAMGAGALGNETTGGNNSAFGNWSGHLITSGLSNSLFGESCGFQIQTGYENCAFGYQTLRYGGYRNTAFGTEAMYGSVNNATNYNTAFGYRAGYSLGSATATATNNTLLGSNAGSAIVDGSNNIIIGANTFGATTASNNIWIGNAGASESNIIRIGAAAGWLTTHNKCFIAGIRSVTTGVANAIPVLISSQGQLGTFSSSVTVKRNIEPLSDDLVQKFYKLIPCQFNFLKDAESEEIHPTIQYGMIAQQVNEHIPELVVKRGNDCETVRYHFFPALLTKVLQSQEKEIKDQDDKMAKQEAKLKELEAKMQSIFQSFTTVQPVMVN